jgi:TRAP-type C4-dicarboxylate transport system permease small subunit
MSAEPDPTLGRGNPRTRLPLKIEEAVMAAAMALLVIITTGNVVTRYLTNISFAFTEEYSISLMVIATLFGTSVAMAAGRHIRIGYFADRSRARTRRVLELVTMAATIAMFAVLAGYGAAWVYDDWRYETTSPGLGVPEWLYTVWLPVLSVLIAGRALGRAIRVWRGDVP